MSSAGGPVIVYKLKKYIETLYVEVCEQVLADSGYMERIRKVVRVPQDAPVSFARHFSLHFC